MNIWDNVVGIEKINSIFEEPIDFHDASVIDIKYDGLNGSIKIDCEGFIKTKMLFNQKYENIDSLIIELNFKNISEFQIDGGYGIIDKFLIEQENEKFKIELNSCGLKFICSKVEIKDVLLITKQSINKNRLLNDYLKSNN